MIRNYLTYCYVYLPFYATAHISKYPAATAHTQIQDTFCRMQLNK